MQPVRLDEAIDGILTAYHQHLDNARESGGLLETMGVKTVIRADHRRPQPLTPAIWVFPNLAMQNQSMSIKEDWEIPIQLTAIIQEKDPIYGYNQAFKLAALARSVILQDRNLGLYYVRDTISKSFETGQPPESRHKNLHAHNSLMITRFNTLE
jgi:hypothetical protein